MRILRVVGTCLLSAIPTLILATLIVFMLQRLIPGDPAVAIAGEYATPENLERIRQDLGLDQSLITQYLTWIGGAFTGDLGTSYQTGESISALVMQRLPLTLILTTMALFVAVAVGLPSGVCSGERIASIPASAPQPITEVAKPVMVVAAIIAHLGVSLVTTIAVPATSNASAKVSMTRMPLRVRSDMGCGSLVTPDMARPRRSVRRTPRPAP